jgi:hypothetical protein
MSSIEIQLVFEGEAVQKGMIDAELFAQSLTGYTQIFRRANAVVNGEASESAVLVESDFKAGSFIVSLQFEQHLIESATHFITNHQFLSAASLAAAIGFVKKGSEWGESLIDLWKWLRGKKPDKVSQVGNNTEITVGTNKKTVNNIVYNLYGDSAVRAAFGGATEPLRREGFNRIAVRQENAEQVAFDKEDAAYFEAVSLQLEPNHLPTEGERDAVLIVSKIAFTEGSTWSFFEQGGTVAAKIEDEEFWQKVHEHAIKFGEGDMLKVKLNWKVEEKNGKLKQKNRIVRVYQVYDRPKQMRLDGGKDDEVKFSNPKRRITLEDE